MPLAIPFLVQHRRVGPCMRMVTADQVRVGGQEGMLAEAHPTPGENLAIEADIGMIRDDDVSVLATQDGAAPDEDTAADVDAAIVGPLRVKTTPVIYHHVVPDSDFVADVEGPRWCRT